MVKDWLSKLAVVATACISMITTTSNAAEFSVPIDRSNSIFIHGEIKQGDFARFQAFSHARSRLDRLFDPHTALLNSPGGDVGEALVFAEAFNKGFFTTIVTDHGICYSACTIMFAAGSIRVLAGKGRLGFHRLSLRGKEIDIRKAQAATDPVNQRVKDFLNSVGFPAVLVEKMNETPPTDLFVIDQSWVSSHGIDSQLSYQPAFLDIVEKNCGFDPLSIFVKSASVTAFRQKDYKAWLDCAYRVKGTNLDIAFIKEMDENERIENAKIESFKKFLKTLQWEAVKGSEGEMFIARNTAKWNGRRVDIWTLSNSTHKGKTSSVVSRNFMNCSDKTSIFVRSVMCEGAMCEKPNSVYEAEDSVPSKPAPDSYMGQAMSAICLTN